MKIKFFQLFNKYAVIIVCLLMPISMNLKLTPAYIVLYTSILFAVYWQANGISRHKAKEKGFVLTSRENDRLRLGYDLELFWLLPPKEDMLLVPGNEGKSDFELVEQALGIVQARREASPKP